jgi:hypothetical protein
MPRTPLFTWKGKEYEHRPKTADWYFAVGIIALSTAVASLLFQNYLLAIVIVLAAIAIMAHAHKAPPIHTFSITEQGLSIDDEVHPYEKMLSFSILEDTEGMLPPVLSIKTSSLLSPHLIIPLIEVSADGVHAIFLERVEEEEHRPSFSDAVAGWLGF